MYGTPKGIEAGIEGEYLLDALFAVGPTEWRGGEEGPISWAELAAYGQATGAITEAWEYEAVKAMSKAYFTAKHAATADVFSIPPVEREGMDE